MYALYICTARTYSLVHILVFSEKKKKKEYRNWNRLFLYADFVGSRSKSVSLLEGTRAQMRNHTAIHAMFVTQFYPPVLVVFGFSVIASHRKCFMSLPWSTHVWVSRTLGHLYLLLHSLVMMSGFRWQCARLNVGRISVWLSHFVARSTLRFVHFGTPRWGKEISRCAVERSLAVTQQF